ncbi:alpha/beta fold hydrolase [Paucibacter sp. XJ19-41]|uniref:alpha/beta fold hydrolase n=1 Tax=Paucibacter sp. XJ19-41 TaxID=2927824 RepID=UPI0023495987|nr:alpha/beta hydrolase [Paucibacter sp. XJ19-41]MDC6169749.1 alpha/beta hydrolase [Paucibacter sp. XJ19-41]
MMPIAYTARRPHRSQFISLRGLRHHVLSWGRPELATTERPTLLMLHGWMDVGASFQFVVDALADERHIIAMDWRGFGLSDSSGADSYWFPDYLGDLDALLDAVAPGQAVDLLGHSMGGNVVMSYAGLRPERIRRLVNLEGFGLPETQPEMAPARLIEWLDDLKTPQRLKHYDSLAGVAQRLMKTNPRLAADKAAWLAPHWSREQNGPEGKTWHILGDAAHKRANPILYRKAEILACWARISAPVLWVEGSETQMSQWWGDRYPREDFEARLAAVPQLQRARLQGAGHMLHHDQPEALAARLQAFLDAD